MYHRLLTATLLAASLFTAPIALAPALAVPLPTCASTLPEAMHRPGGFCDLRQASDTLAAPVTAVQAEEPPAAPPSGGGGGGCGALDLRQLFLHLPLGARIHTAC